MSQEQLRALLAEALFGETHDYQVGLGRLRLHETTEIDPVVRADDLHFARRDGDAALTDHGVQLLRALCGLRLRVGREDLEVGLAPVRMTQEDVRNMCLPGLVPHVMAFLVQKNVVVRDVVYVGGNTERRIPPMVVFATEEGEKFTLREMAVN